MRRPTTLRLPLALAALGLCGCQARISGAPADLATDAGRAPTDSAAPSDGPAVVQLGPWSTPSKISVASGAPSEEDVSLSSNTLELFFAIDPTDASDTTGKHLFYSSRATVTGDWSDPVKLPFDSAVASDETPRLSSDDKTLYFASARAGNGNLDIFKAVRSAPGRFDWGKADPVPVSTTTLNEKWFAPCQDGHYIMAQSAGNDPPDLVEGVVGGADPIGVDALNSMASETGAFLTADCLTVYFASTRSNTSRLYRAQRNSLTSPWSQPARVTDFAVTGGNQEDPWISPDGKTFAFVSDAAAAGNKDIYLSTRNVILGAR
jgi:hypothetical protein